MPCNEGNGAFFCRFSGIILSSIAKAITLLLIPGGLLVTSAFFNAISLIKKEGKEYCMILS